MDFDQTLRCSPSGERSPPTDPSAPCLLLSVTGPGGTRARACRIGPAGAWIGRSPSCDVFIEDPERIVSLQHCRIDFADGHYGITDQSTNGTYLNGAGEPLPKGERRPLEVGDRFRVGRFQITTEAPMPDTPDAPLALVEPATSPLLDPPWALNEPPAERAQQSDAVLRGTNGKHTSERLERLLSDLIPDAGATPRNRRLDCDLALFPRSSPAEPAPAVPPDVPPVALAEPFSAPAKSVPPPGTPPVAATADPSPGPRTVPRPIVSPDTELNRNPFDDLAHVMTGRITHPADASGPPLRTPPPNGADPQSAACVPYRGGAAATTALAAFWCGLGMVPANLDPASLASLMAQFGSALREAADGFGVLLGSCGQSDRSATNPFIDGRRGLRRFIGRGEPAAPRLEDAVHDVFTLAAEHEDAYVDAVRGALLHALVSMTPRAVEARFRTSLRSHPLRQAARRAELIELMSSMEDELVELAEAQFRRELRERMRPRLRKLLTFDRCGST